MKKDIDISKRWTSHFCISYRSRNICLDCGCYINISDWIVQKLIVTERIMYKWSLSILFISHLMVLVNLYFKDIGFAQTSIFSPNTVFHSLHSSQQSLQHVYFLQFSLISIRPPHFYINLWNLQIALVTDFPRVIIITLVLFRQSNAAYWLRWYKIHVTNVFCIHRKLFGSGFQRTMRLTLPVKNLNIQNGMFIIMDVREGNFSERTLFSQERRLIITIIDDSLSYLFLMLVFQINSFSMTKPWEARNEWEIGLFIKTRQDSTIRRKVTRKKQVKFAIVLNGLFICLFQFSYWSL